MKFLNYIYINVAYEHYDWSNKEVKYKVVHTSDWSRQQEYMCKCKRQQEYMCSFAWTTRDHPNRWKICVNFCWLNNFSC